jgi:hypothetical protein
MIHGWADNCKNMQLKRQSLTEKLNQAGDDCIFLQARLELPMTSTVQIEGQAVTITNGVGKDARAWFLYNKDDPGDASPALPGAYIEYIGVEE